MKATMFSLIKVLLLLSLLASLSSAQSEYITLVGLSVSM
jgi:hypothetical protein